MEECAEENSDLVSAVEGGSGGRRSSGRWWQMTPHRHGREERRTNPSSDIAAKKCTIKKKFASSSGCYVSTVKCQVQWTFGVFLDRVVFIGFFHATTSAFAN
jgi:hypothetical protein